MATPSPVRLLIADRSENRAHEIDSVLRNAGIPTRVEFCADLSEISDAEQPIDLLLCRSHFDHLEQVLPALRKLKPNLPIIVMDDSPEPKNLTRGLAMGATDVIINNDNERLLHVVKRELENVNQRDRFSQTFDHGSRGIVRRRQHLVDALAGALFHHQEVGERSADIDTDPQRHCASRTTMASAPIPNFASLRGIL
jgi:DNA-binding NtrC family response regulator